MRKIIRVVFLISVIALVVHSLYYSYTSMMVMEKMNHHWLSQLGLFVIHTSIFKMTLAFGFILALMDFRWWPAVLAAIFIIGVALKPYFGLKQIVFTPEYVYFPLLFLLAVLRSRFTGGTLEATRN